MNKMMKRMALLAACLIVVGVIGDAWVFLSGMWNREIESHQEQGTYSTQGLNVKQLELKLKSGELTVRPGDVETPVVHYWITDAAGRATASAMIREERQAERLQLTLGDGWSEAGITNGFKQRVMGDGWHQLHYEIELPRQMYDQLVIDVDGGKAGIEGINAGQMRVRLNAGRLRLEQSKANSIELAVQGGSFTMNDAQAELVSGTVAAGTTEFNNIRAKIDLKMRAGSFSLEQKELTDDLMLAGEAGHLEVKLGHVSTPYLLEVNSRSGAVDIDLPEAKYKGGGVNHFRKQIGGSGGPTVKIEANSGKVDID